MCAYTVIFFTITPLSLCKETLMNNFVMTIIKRIVNQMKHFFCIFGF